MPALKKRKWKELTTRQRVALVGIAAVDAALRVWAGSDLASRTPEQVNGPKWLWGAGLTVVNSSGILPATYLLVGRKRD
ncbi:MAG: hypothetical protein QM658_08095 [Gordonia sp. (in: high G+C Gram-positive bacteria)]